MSFTFKWEHFDQEHVYTRAKELLTDALNKGQKPPIIVDRIDVQDLSLGDVPPKLEILDIGDLGVDRFRGIFKLNYEGNASLTFATKIQANPLNIVTQNAPDFSFPKIVGAANSFPMPLTLTLSDIRMSGIIILVYSRAKGLTLVFRNDPLESIRVSSTFDALPGIAKFVQVQIENLIRTLFREELPGILHKLSQRWTTSHSFQPPEIFIDNKSNNELDAKTLNRQLINPFAIPADVALDNPSPEFSHSNMLKLASLSANQKTLNIFTPSIPDVIYRSSLESYERRRLPAYHASAALNLDSFISSNRCHDIIQKQLCSPRKVANIKPKRRVIKLRKPVAEQAEKADDGQFSETPASTPTETAMAPVTPANITIDEPSNAEPAVVLTASADQNTERQEKIAKRFFMSNAALQHEDVPPPYAAYAA